MNGREIAHGFAWNALFNALNRVLFPLIGILLARMLGPAQMGAFAVIATVFSLADIFRDGGIGASYVSDSKAVEREAEYERLARRLSYIVAGIALVTLPFLAGIFKGYPDLRVGMAIIAVALAINGWGTIPSAKLNREARFREAGSAEFKANLVGYVIALGLVSLGVGFLALAIQMLVKVCLFAFLMRRLAPVDSGPHSTPLGQRFRGTLPVMANNLLYSFYTMADNLLVARFFPAAIAGGYAVAYNVASKPVEFISFPLGRTLFVAFSRRSDDPDAMARLVLKAFSMVALVAIPAYAWLALYAQEVIVFLYGPAFGLAGPILSLLCIYLGLRSVGSLAGSALIAMRKPAWANVGWLLGIAVLAFLVFSSPGDLMSIVNAIVWGAVTAYGCSIFSAIILMRPRAEDVALLVLCAITGWLAHYLSYALIGHVPTIQSALAFLVTTGGLTAICFGTIFAPKGLLSITVRRRQRLANKEE